jgi:hypothetical protein
VAAIISGAVIVMSNVFERTIAHSVFWSVMTFFTAIITGALR